MKTALACLFILIAALAFGKWQGADIDDLQHRLDQERIMKKSPATLRERREETSGYRSKYERKGAGLTAPQAFEVLLAMPRSLGVSSGPDVALENRETLQILAQLDLRGLEELVELVQASKDPSFKEEMHRYENALLCLISMTELDPQAALDYLAEHEKRLFSYLGDDEPRMLPYILARMADRDPQAALGVLSAIRDGSTSLRITDDARNKLLGLIARWEPLRVLETVDTLPPEDLDRVWTRLFHQLKSDEEWTALFHAMRTQYGSKPEMMAAGMKELSSRFRLTAESADETRQWVDSLGMTDAEKRLLCGGLRQMDISPEQGEACARWFAEFLPESEEKTQLVLKAAEAWHRTNPAAIPAVLAFLREQGIEVQRHDGE